MHTLFDFISRVNGMQYIIALCSVTGFAVFMELLSPKPFEGLVKAIAEDARHIRAGGTAKLFALGRNAAVAAGCAAMYFASLPVLFANGMVQNLGEGIGDLNPTGWNPVRAYFVKRGKSRKAVKSEVTSKEEEGEK